MIKSKTFTRLLLMNKYKLRKYTSKTPHMMNEIEAQEVFKMINKEEHQWKYYSHLSYYTL